jgi:histidinol-phosphatase
VAASQNDLDLALELADMADAMTLERFRAEDLVVETKPDLTPVTEADRGVEQALRQRLASLRPEDAVVGEEYGAEELRSSGRRWIVDPIDGTKSYVRGIPVWATLLALEDRGEVTVGVVSAPALGRRWWAGRKLGAFGRDGLGGSDGSARRLQVSAIRALEDAQLCFAGFEEWRETGRLDGLLALSARCWRSRGYGDFWQYMMVAEGTMEIGIDPQVSLWDLAAPMIVVEEAGGRFTDLAGAVNAEGGDAIATNGILHEAARAFVAR